MKPMQAHPTASCRTCGTRIRAESQVELIQKYTTHQVEEHDKPSLGGV